MTIPWSHLGLTTFVLAAEEQTIICSEGNPTSQDHSELALPHLAYAETNIDGESTVVNLRLLAQLLLPTLPDHRLAALANHFAIPQASSESDTPCAVTRRLLELACSRQPAVCRSLAQLVGGATGELLERCALHHSPTGYSDRVAEPDMETSPSPLPASVHRFAELERVFLPGGVMADRIAAYEHRPAQIEMAVDVATAMGGGGTVLVEAGPGTGKTFAYLVPILLYLAEHPSARAVLSTRTRHLQDQLYEKDLPQLVASLAPGLRCALVKGRENYICIRRWNHFLQERPLPLQRAHGQGKAQSTIHPETVAVSVLMSWLSDTRTGDIEENAVFQSLDGHRELWAKLRDDPLHCPAAACPHYEDCFSFRARRAARAARLVIANHSLVMSDLASAGRLLGPYEILVADEAHSLEAAARDAFTYTLTSTVIERLLRDLESRSGRKRSGWIQRISTTLPTADVAALRRQYKLIDQGNHSLFDELDKLIPRTTPDRSPSFEAVERSAQTLAEQLRLLSRLVLSATEPLEDAEPIREGELLSGAAEEAAGVLLHLLVSPRSDDEVHWYERTADRLTLHAAPIEVGPILGRTLYPKLDSLVLTSATLAPSHQFGYIRQSLGLDASPHPTIEKIVPGSFDYAHRMTVVEARFAPSVSAESDYATTISELLATMHKATPRNTLVLFTSNRMLNEVRTRLPRSLPVLAQGTDGSKQGITRRFRQHPHGILLATGSFWEGIDLPGRQLEVLIITRLPFSVPTEPVFAAQAERAAHAGRDPFLDLALPLAVLRFRQGIGRLIRTESDAGMVIITDTRISQRRYGAAFRESLPVPMISADTPAAIVRRLTQQFSQDGPSIDRPTRRG